MKTHLVWRTPLWWERYVYHQLPAPLVDHGQGLERGFPWRMGTCWIFRLPGTHQAVAFGRWTAEQPHENVDGVPSLSFRPLEHPEEYFHVEPSTGASEF